jgi:DNA invertase Pin-like site-specific DNA recombinase
MLDESDLTFSSSPLLTGSPDSRHFLEVLDEPNHLNIEFIGLRENIDTSGPLGRAIVVIVGAIAEPEKSLIVERVRAGMRRAKLEGRRIGRAPMNINREQVVRDRRPGMSLRQVAAQGSHLARVRSPADEGSERSGPSEGRIHFDNS